MKDDKLETLNRISIDTYTDNDSQVHNILPKRNASQSSGSDIDFHSLHSSGLSCVEILDNSSLGNGDIIHIRDDNDMLQPPFSKKLKFSENPNIITVGTATATDQSTPTSNKLLTLEDLAEYIKISGDNIKIIKVLTDIENSRCEEGWYYRNSGCVKITCTYDGHLLKTIALKNLKKRGFTIPLDIAKVLTKETLEQFIMESRDNISIISITCDDKKFSFDSHFKSCKFISSANVHIEYSVEGDCSYSIRLDNLLERGFNAGLKNSTFRFYSYLEMKKQLRKHCRTSGCSYNNVFDNKLLFEEALKKVHNYYLFNPEYAKNEEIERFRGPQNFEKRNNEDKLHYYGRGKIKYYRWEDMQALIENDFGQSKALQFYLNPGSDIIDEERFEEYLWLINDSITHNAHRHKYKQKHDEYAGPQYYEDRNTNTKRERQIFLIQYYQICHTKPLMMKTLFHY